MEALTKESFLELWRKELLPNIKNEIAVQTQAIKEELSDLKERMKSIEKAQEFLSSKYDSVSQVLQSIKKQLASTEKSVIKQQDEMLKLQTKVSEVDAIVDELQQYSRRDCLEISGIPRLPNDEPNKIIMELGDIIGVQMSESDISVAHRLPDSKKTKDRTIVKFTRRQKKDEFYSRRSRLIGKQSTDLPSVEISPRGTKPSRVFINESLTSLRKILLGKINAFKKEHRFKFLWTVNGKVFLRENENSNSFGFTSEAEFEKFKNSL